MNPPKTDQEKAGQERGSLSTDTGRLPATRRNDAAINRSWVLRRILAVSDWAAILLALAITTAATTDMNVSKLFWAAVASPLCLLIIKLHGLYDHDHRRIRHSTLDELPGLISAMAISTLALDGLLSLSPTGSLSASSVILVGVLGVLFALVMRGITRFWWHGRIPAAIGIVVGSPENAEIIMRRLETHPEARLKIAGYLTPAGIEATGDRKVEHLGSVADLRDVSQNLHLDRVVIAGEGVTGLEIEWLIGECKSSGMGLTLLPRHFALFGPAIELNRLAELPVLDFRFSPPARSTILLKRTMDVVVSAALLLLSAPILLGSAVLIKLDSRGPVFFRQRRAGKDGVPFAMLKLRTMCVDAEEKLSDLLDLEQLEEPAFKIENDPRVTRVGRVLRRLSLDELPQLINVLRGEMSLVGPRPEEEAVVALYDERQRVRLSVKPGLTGPMQVSGRGDLTFEERLALDRDYLDNISITGDLALLLRTPRAIIRGDGAF